MGYGDATYLQNAEIAYQGQRIALIASDMAGDPSIKEWHGPANPSTWLSVSTFWAARRRVQQAVPGAPDRPTLELAALALGISIEKLVEAIRWHENYMRWHDADDEYRVLEDNPPADHHVG